VWFLGPSLASQSRVPLTTLRTSLRLYHRPQVCMESRLWRQIVLCVPPHGTVYVFFCFCVRILTPYAPTLAPAGVFRMSEIPAICFWVGCEQEAYRMNSTAWYSVCVYAFVCVCNLIIYRNDGKCSFEGMGEESLSLYMCVCVCEHVSSTPIIPLN